MRHWKPSVSICLGWRDTEGRCTSRTMGARRSPYWCDACDAVREEELQARMDRIAREMREEVGR